MDNNEVKLHEEIQKMEYEPLDPVELKLVRWSIGLGIFLLVVLFLISKFVMTTH
ncbi:bacteriocin-type signal sequence [Desulfovibrio legallii]|jgi:hypothetical protein|uniref:Bacteriocin-type signal sequence n=1 Tax=Desulfovibrio legallii TaxID=571438 RepID=A0A6H3FDN4_9BACT|nr:bacteriocin-type signal sequence [Desulfovibrio legallii]RHH22922.1 bacteriocin-type signal sequence [Desulfovibrio sp. AM18-2]TBH81129.1 bacteriocin-type signal sequence [Desulfovibrio legallii]CAI3228374.1 hypothetical protein DWUX_946 [Desulfovibrio diazotrophicus]VVU43182.1 hypothetical protein DWUX_528 [Desulfovibrio diazotrophicus]